MFNFIVKSDYLDEKIVAYTVGKKNYNLPLKGLISKLMEFDSDEHDSMTFWGIFQVLSHKKATKSSLYTFDWRNIFSGAIFSKESFYF